ncbi:MAG: hypothetical protein U0Q19_19550 [Kineosporiaceae bacterium]
MGLSMVQRRAVLASQVAAWPKATKVEKSTILDHLVAVNGWHRDHARKMIRAAVAGGGCDRTIGQRRAARAPVYTYDETVITALATCWAVLGGPTGKRLQPALADLVPALLAHGELPDDQGDRCAVVDVGGHHRPAPQGQRVEEFINHHLLKWATDRQITFTKAGPPTPTTKPTSSRRTGPPSATPSATHRYDTPENWPCSTSSGPYKPS